MEPDRAALWGKAFARNQPFPFFAAVISAPFLSVLQLPLFVLVLQVWSMSWRIYYERLQTNYEARSQAWEMPGAREEESEEAVESQAQEDVEAEREEEEGSENERDLRAIA